MGWACVALALLFSLACPTAAIADSFAYVYINASEGSASGGHAALQFDDEVFHFQYAPPGLLRIKRDSFEQFWQQYGIQENRTIHLHHIELATVTKTTLREHFNRLSLIQDEQFAYKEGLENDIRLLQTLTFRQSGAGHLELKGLGLFFTNPWDYTATTPAPFPPSASITELSRHIEAVFGEGFLATKEQQTLAELTALRTDDEGYGQPTLDDHRFEAAAYSLADRYHDKMIALAAVQIVRLGLPVREINLLQPGIKEFRLNRAEKQGLIHYRDSLIRQITGLLNSQRPDWGYALLVASARLVAIDYSIRSGYLTLLNFKPIEDEASAINRTMQVRPCLSLKTRFLKAKSRLGRAESLDEWGYAELEQAANRWLTHQNLPALTPYSDAENPLSACQASDGDEALSFHWQIPATPIALNLSAAAIESSLNWLQTRLEDYHRQLAVVYPYQLLDRNCATELFRQIELALSVQPDSGKETGNRPTHPLGQSIDRHGLAFIPFLSFDEVGQHWPVLATEELPSFRQLTMDYAKRKQAGWITELQESNPFSSSYYQWHGKDAAFVFFTDRLLWLRPLAGGVNLVSGLAQFAYGLVSWPWDRGEQLMQGTKGVFVSLPELVFCNIRKGSFPRVNLDTRERANWSDRVNE